MRAIMVTNDIANPRYGRFEQFRLGQLGRHKANKH